MSLDGKLILLDTRPEELEWIYRLEQSGQAQDNIIPYSLERHQDEFAKSDVVYKSIWQNDEPAGFLILVLDPDGHSIEFRRIVIAMPDRGFGKQTVRMAAMVCRRDLGRDRIWLDVFETNKRARYVYEQCGYRPFGKSEYQGRTLLLYEIAA